MDPGGGRPHREGGPSLAELTKERYGSDVDDREMMLAELTRERFDPPTRRVCRDARAGNAAR